MGADQGADRKIRVCAVPEGETGFGKVTFHLVELVRRLVGGGDPAGSAVLIKLLPRDAGLEVDWNRHN